MSDGRLYDGFLPGRFPFDAYGNGGFRFADMSHRGSLLALVLFGGQAIQGFAQVMLYGVVICTYSAICISSPMLIYIGLRGSETVKVPEGRAAAAE